MEAFALSEHHITVVAATALWERLPVGVLASQVERGGKLTAYGAAGWGLPERAGAERGAAVQHCTDAFAISVCPVQMHHLPIEGRGAGLLGRAGWLGLCWKPSSSSGSSSSRSSSSRSSSSRSSSSEVLFVSVLFVSVLFVSVLFVWRSSSSPSSSSNPRHGFCSKIQQIPGMHFVLKSRPVGGC